MIAAVLLLAAAPLQGTPTKSMRAVDALGLFKRVCIDTSLDPARFDVALAAEPDAYRERAVIPGMEKMPGGSYLSEHAEVNLAAYDNPPPGLPSRICGVLAQAHSATDHAAFAAMMMGALSLPTGQTRAVGQSRSQERMLTEWNRPEGVNKLRYVLITRAEPKGGPLISLSITRLKVE